MTKSIFTFGSILGTILCANMIYMVYKCYNDPYFETNDILGWIAMTVAFSLTFFGIKNYRDKELNGIISLGKAFKTGALIVLLASTIYVVVWLFYYYLFVPDFIEKYAQHVLYMAKKEGASASEIISKKKEMEQYGEMYKNPVLIILLTYMEVLPLGLVVAFISSLVLKKKQTAL